MNRRSVGKEIIGAAIAFREIQHVVFVAIRRLLEIHVVLGVMRDGGIGGSGVLGNAKEDDVGSAREGVHANLNIWSAISTEVIVAVHDEAGVVRGIAHRQAGVRRGSPNSGYRNWMRKHERRSGTGEERRPFVGGDPGGEHVAVVIGVKHEGRADLAHVAQLHGFIAGVIDGLERREEQGDKNGYNRDDDQQLDEGEGGIAGFHKQAPGLNEPRGGSEVSPLKAASLSTVACRARSFA